ncbi:Fbox/WD repeatcontaining protein 11like, partial [Caligus rogercresseyi]
MYHFPSGVKTLARWMKKYVVTGSYDGTLKIWREEDWTLLESIRLKSDSVWDCRSCDPYLAACSLDDTIFLFQYQEERENSSFNGNESESPFRLLRRIVDYGRQISSLDLNYSLILQGRDDGIILVRSIEGSEIRSLEGHTQGVTGIRFLPPIRGYDSYLRIWNVSHGICLAILRGHSDFIRSLAINDSRLVSGDFGGFVRVWELSDIFKEINAYLDSLLSKLRGNPRAAQSDSAPLEIFSHRSFYPHRGH